jgi:DNA-directed RNA polymerase specialized sigma24 family protein
VNTTQRLENLLALLLIQQMKAATRAEKVLQLNIAGFSNVEIADILQTTPDVVSDALYAARRTRRKVTKPAR